MHRIGFGYDSHRFANGRPLVLGGVVIDHPQGLAGHSDGDAVLHAITDAILGALADGDIGHHFPPTDQRWRNANSELFVRHAVGRAHARAATINHADITIICESPKIAPHTMAMRTRVAAMLGIEVGCVSVKATTTEGLGFTGRREGIAAQATVTMQVPE